MPFVQAECWGLELIQVCQFNPIELGFGWLKKYLRRHVQHLGGTNKAVLTALYPLMGMMGSVHSLVEPCIMGSVHSLVASP